MLFKVKNIGVKLCKSEIDYEVFSLLLKVDFKFFFFYVLFIMSIYFFYRLLFGKKEFCSYMYLEYMEIILFYIGEYRIFCDGRLV